MADELGPDEQRRWFQHIEEALAALKTQVEHLNFVRNDTWDVEKQLLNSRIDANKTLIETEVTGLRKQMDGTRDTLKRIGFALFGIIAAGVAGLVFAGIKP